MTNNKSDDMEESGRELINVLLWYLPRGPEEDHEEPVMMTNVLAMIQTKHLLNTSLKHYCYIMGLLDSKFEMTCSK
jgi:hypothetical protein